jgi:integrase
MNRPRKTHRHLPPCVHLKHGAYFYVKRGKWRLLAHDLPTALREYAKLHSAPSHPIAKLIEDATPSVLRDERGNALAASTQSQYKVALRRLADILADFTPAQITARHVLQIRESFLPHVAVANRVVIVLRKVLDYALMHGHVDNNAAVGIKAISQDARTRRITAAEYAAIKANGTPLLAVVMDLLYLTGQRVGDVLAIKRADLTTDGIEFQQEKTDARLVVAWNEDLRGAVERAKATGGKVVGAHLLMKRGRPVTYTMIWKQWTKACKAAKVEDANIHDVRAMSGTEAKAQGLDSQALLGHTDAKQTRRYLRDRVVPVVDGPRFAAKK